MWERLQGARVGGLWCGGSPSGGLGASAGCRPRSSVGVGDCRSPGGATAAGGNSPVAPRQQPLHHAHGRRKGGCWRRSTRKPLLGLRLSVRGLRGAEGHKVNKHYSLDCHNSYPVGSPGERGVDLYATGLLHRFTTARQRETCARQLSHAGGQPRDSARQPRDSARQRETARDSRETAANLT